MITRSGRWVELDSGVPTLADIAHSLARQHRWCGVGEITIASHSCLVAEMAYTMSGDMRLWAGGILHDIQESVMGEVPLGIKTDEFSRLEAEVYGRIIRYTFGVKGGLLHYPVADRAAAAIEAHHIGGTFYRRFCAESRNRGHNIPTGDTLEAWGFILRAFMGRSVDEEESKMLLALEFVKTGLKRGFGGMARKIGSSLKPLPFPVKFKGRA